MNPVIVIKNNRLINQFHGEFVKNKNKVKKCQIRSKRPETTNKTVSNLHSISRWLLIIFPKQCSVKCRTIRWRNAEI